MKTKDEKIFDIINYSFMVFLCIIILYPVWYIIVLSFNDGADAAKGGIYFFPRIFTIQNFKVVMENPGLIRSFLVTILRTAIGAFTHVLFTATVAYALSKQRLVGRNIFLTIGVITMFFNGGLIPTYILIKNLGLENTFWVYIIPSMFNFFELIIFLGFFREHPPSLEESAFLDGANDFQIFVLIILPLSMPVLATITLFNGVWHWNDFFTGIIYIRNDDLQTIQTFLYKVIGTKFFVANFGKLGWSNICKNHYFKIYRTCYYGYYYPTHSMHIPIFTKILCKRIVCRECKRIIKN